MKWLVAAMLLCVAACAADEEAESRERCHARVPTIAGGAYGCAEWSNEETGGMLRDRTYSIEASGDDPSTFVEVSTLTTDGDGFYQVALAPGRYRLCIELNHYCTQPVELSGGLQRSWVLSELQFVWYVVQ